MPVVPGEVVPCVTIDAWRAQFLSDANKYAGRSITNFYVDLIEAWSEPTVFDRLQGNLLSGWQRTGARAAR
jgi:hypothetical protein